MLSNHKSTLSYIDKLSVSTMFIFIIMYYHIYYIKLDILP